MRFSNRADAGRQLATILRSRPLIHPVVVGVVRGGVPVAAEIANVLHAPLEICVVRSLIPHTEPRTVIGAVAERGAMFLEPGRAAWMGLGDREIEQLVSDELAEVDRLADLLRDRPAIDLRGRDVILVDDGIVTGTTIRAAIRSMRRVARAVELAVPVGASEVLERVTPYVDSMHCLIEARSLTAVGARYETFEPVSEAEVASLLAAASARTASSRLAPGLLHRSA